MGCEGCKRGRGTLYLVLDRITDVIFSVSEGMDMGVITKYSDLCPKKKAFVEHYIQTNDLIGSYFAAGYLQGVDQTSYDKRMQAYRAARAIIANPLVRDYIAMNKPVVIPETGEIDVKQITDRMLLIMNGNIEQQILVKGELHYIKPSFRDQIEAAKLLNAISEKREKKSEKRASKALSSKVVALIGSARMNDGQESED